MIIKELKSEHPRIYNRILECQKEQGNEPNDNLDLNAIKISQNFDWDKAVEGFDFWDRINKKDFNVFYEYYPDPLQKEVENFVNESFKNNRVFESGSKRDSDDNKPLVNHLDSYLRLRVGYRMRDGANKYDKGNWRKGQPTETALESLNRHLAYYEENLNNGVEQDEDHLAGMIFNIQLIMQNEKLSGIPADKYFKTTK